MFGSCIEQITIIQSRMKRRYICGGFPYITKTSLIKAYYNLPWKNDIFVTIFFLKPLILVHVRSASPIRITNNHHLCLR